MGIQSLQGLQQMVKNQQQIMHLKIVSEWIYLSIWWHLIWQQSIELEKHAQDH